MSTKIDANANVPSSVPVSNSSKTGKQVKIMSFFKRKRSPQRTEDEENKNKQLKLQNNETGSIITSNNYKFVKLGGLKPKPVDMPYWKYVPRYLSKSIFDDLYDEIKPLLQEYSIGEYETISRRKSTVLTSVIKNSASGNKDAIYDGLVACDWSASPIVLKIKEKLFQDYGYEFDLVLIHEYPDGRAMINWHSDREALNSPIISISFGEERTFLLRATKSKFEWDYKYVLGSGDLFIMKTGCQQRFVHTIQPEPKVKLPRLNLTFRKRDTGTH